MSLVTLADVLRPALQHGYAVAGVVCLGWEDMRAFVTAAELERAPIILQAGPACREHTPVPILARMFRYLAENASVPVVAHLDHAYSRAECHEAISEGFTSVMYDGSRKPLPENIEETAAIVAMAHEARVSCEGEIGFVGYAGGARSAGTDPAEAARFARETGVDAMAISIGNVHLQQSQEGRLDEDRLRAIEAVTDLPLVIHGGSGVPAGQRLKLAGSSHICKFNIGTELRMAFGAVLREAVMRDATRFDRLSILKETHEPVVQATRNVLRGLGSSGRA
jgi:fructose-bisphosphate aldolase class II